MRRRKSFVKHEDLTGEFKAIQVLANKYKDPRESHSNVNIDETAYFLPENIDLEKITKLTAHDKSAQNLKEWDKVIESADTEDYDNKKKTMTPYNDTEISVETATSEEKKRGVLHRATELHALLLKWPRKDVKENLEKFVILRNHILKVNQMNPPNDKFNVNFADACFPTDSSIFAGQTALHIAIVNNDEDTVRTLVSTYKADVHCRATGTFFNPSEMMFYGGEYPLSFAVVKNNEKIVEFLLNNGADPFRQDALGNTVFHICVIYNRVQIFDQIVTKINYFERFKFDKTSLWSLNKTKKVPVIGTTKAIGSSIMQMASMGTRSLSRASMDRDSVTTFELDMLPPVVATPSRGSTLTVPPSGISMSFTLLNDQPSPTRSEANSPNNTMPERPFVDFKRQTKNELVQKLLKIENKDRKTSLAWAAELGRVRMFRHIMDLYREPVLEYGHMEGSAYPISVIDTYPIPDQHSILHLIIYGNDDLHRAKLLEITPIKQLLNEKWNTFAKYVFWLHAIVYLTFAIIFTLVVSNVQSFNDTQYGFSAAQIMLVVILGIAFLVEVLDLINIGIKNYVTERGSRYFFALLWLFVLIIITVGILRYSFPATLPPDLLANSCGQYCEVERVLLAVASVFVWTYSLFFLRMYRFVGILVVVIRSMLLGDIARWIVVYLVVCLGFVLAFANLYNVPMDSSIFDVDTTPNLDSFSVSLRSLYKVLFGDFTDFGFFTGSWSSSMSVAVFVAYTIMCNLLLLTMLIAALNYTFDFVLTQSQLQANLESATMVLLFERRISLIPFVRDKFRSGTMILGSKHSDANTRYIFVSESYDKSLLED